MLLENALLLACYEDPHFVPGLSFSLPFGKLNQKAQNLSITCLQSVRVRRKSVD